MTKYIRFHSHSGDGYGILDGDTVRVLSGDLFGSHTESGATHRLSDVRLLCPCEARQDPGGRLEL